MKSEDPNNWLATLKQTRNYTLITTAPKEVISIPIKQKIDAFAALAAAEQSKMDCGVTFRHAETA